MIVSLVFHLPEAAVGLDELVPALDQISVADLVLGLYVTRVVVVDGV